MTTSQRAAYQRRWARTKRNAQDRTVYARENPRPTVARPFHCAECGSVLARDGTLEWCPACGYETPASAARPLPLRSLYDREPPEPPEPHDRDRCLRCYGHTGNRAELRLRDDGRWICDQCDADGGPGHDKCFP
jgi:hypothetical protein